MNFEKCVVLDASEMAWQPSPMKGVERKPLAREQAERGHATSLVRYAPSSIFRSHPHPLGEEILVLSGVFSDESGHFPAGTYFRNPPGSSHAPYSKTGCTLLVKLHQFLEQDLNQVQVPVTAMNNSDWRGSQVLYEFENERVMVCAFDQESEDSFLDILCSRSIEIFVIEGEFSYEGYQLKKYSWLRTPNFDFSAFSLNSSVILWIKQGHFAVDY